MRQAVRSILGILTLGPFTGESRMKTSVQEDLRLDHQFSPMAPLDMGSYF